MRSDDSAWLGSQPETAVIEFDAEGALTELNPAAERLFGVRRADVLGASVANFVPARFRPRYEAAARARLDTGAARILGNHIEIAATRADGTEFPVELCLVESHRADGRRCFIGILLNLTESRKAEESLVLHEHALTQVQFGIVVWNVNARIITRINPAYAALVGYEPDEIIGTSGEQLIAHSSQPALPNIARTLRDRGHYTFALRLLRKDGTTVPVLASSSNVESPSGILMQVTTVIDISERDQYEQERAAANHALEQSALRLAALSGAAHEFAGESARIESLLTLVARRIGEIVGDGCVVRLISLDGTCLEPSTSFYHPDPEVREFVRPLLCTERQRLGEGLSGGVAATGIPVLIPVVNADRLIPLAPPAFRPIVSRVTLASALAIPLRSRGRTIGVITLVRSKPGNPYTLDDQRFAQDLADRAGLAIDNAVLVATLEHQVAERTAALEAANRELEAFSYSASHDLRTPLRAIDGFSQLLLEDYKEQIDADGLNCLRRIRSATQRMGALIEDLLKLSRISRITLNIAEHDLSSVAADVVADLRRRDPGRTVPVHIAPGLLARADARLLQILLENLLGNAWKFTSKHDQAQIWVGAEGNAFYVRDTGAGFDMAYATKLFAPFERLHSASEYDGTGVGLAIVQRIVIHHGGRIWAKAEIGKGAVFYFTLGSASDLSK